MKPMEFWVDAEFSDFYASEKDVIEAVGHDHEYFCLVVRAECDAELENLKVQLMEKDATIKALVEALEFVKSDCGGYEKEIEAGADYSYIWEHVSGRAKTAARQALANYEATKGEK